MERRTREARAIALDAQPIEVAERKGLGHPDTICDAIVEDVACALTAAYRARVGRVMPMNVDKALLAGGASAPRFGGGHVTRPMRLVLGGRAHARALGGEPAVAALATEAARRWLSQHLRFVEPRHVEIEASIHPTSEELQTVLSGEPRANDSSVGVGHAPPTRVERTILEVDEALRAMRSERPWLGEDLKILAVRSDDALELTLAVAFVARFVPTAKWYFVEKAELAERVAAGVRATERFARVDVRVNLLDDPTREVAYLTVTGTSAEAGDDGQVGRGNRVDGLIAFGRPMSLEAAAGKNPASHVGKIYNVLAHRAATALAMLDGVAEASVTLVSQIGRRLDDPRLAEARLVLEPGCARVDVVAEADATLMRELERVSVTIEDLVEGRARVF